MGTSTGTAGTVFNWLYNLSASTGLIAWVVSVFFPSDLITILPQLTKSFAIDFVRSSSGHTSDSTTDSRGRASTDEISPSSRPCSPTCLGTGSSSSSSSSSSAGTPSSSRATGILRTFSRISQYRWLMFKCRVRWLIMRSVRFVVAYSLSVIIFPIVYFGWKITKRTRWIRLNEVRLSIQPDFFWRNLRLIGAFTFCRWTL